MKKHFDITVSGKVQGVFYRASAKEKALELGLKGFVKNLFNGNVYIEAEGDAGAIEAFIAWCKKGPLGARVEKVDVLEGPIQQFKNFEVRR